MCNAMAEIRRWQLWFPFLMVIIAVVSLYDTWMIVRFQNWIVQLEENPVGSWLLNVGYGEIGLFVRTKVAGTIVVLTVLTLMWIRQSRLLFPITSSVASYQAGLMVYLTIV